jgi:hypothetical protein
LPKGRSMSSASPDGRSTGPIPPDLMDASSTPPDGWDISPVLPDPSGRSLPHPMLRGVPKGRVKSAWARKGPGLLPNHSRAWDLYCSAIPQYRSRHSTTPPLGHDRPCLGACACNSAGWIGTVPPKLRTAPVKGSVGHTTSLVVCQGGTKRHGWAGGAPLLPQ